MFDRDVIDGSLAAQFATRLAELVEDGFGLVEWRAFWKRLLFTTASFKQ